MTEQLNSRDRFTVIEGGGTDRPQGWLNPPATVVGRSPFSRSRIMSYRVSEIDLRKQLMAGKRQPLLDLWWQVHGQLPPVAGVRRYVELARAATGFGNAHAAFRGIMRPAGRDDRGFDYVAFISKPKIGFRYEPSMSCVVSPFDISDDLVFISYARLDFPEGRGYRKGSADKMPVTDGVLTHWHLVEADPSDPLLPIDHADRFRLKLW